jgi:excisionase family DNA binding protein
MREMTSSSHDQELISTEQLARFLGVSVNTIYAWRHRGEGPPAYRVGRHNRFKPQEVLAWLEGRRNAIGSPAGSQCGPREEVSP